MRSIVKFTVKQAVLINVLFVILVVGGAFSLLTTPVENMPTADLARVLINTVYYGASADDVENLVTIQIEEALEDLESVEYIQSNSYRNFSSVEVKFVDDSKYRDLYDELRFRIQNIRNELPMEADESTFTFMDSKQWPVITVNLMGEMAPAGLQRYADELEARLLKISGVRNVEVSGEYDQEFHVSLDPEKLRRFGITFNQALDAVNSANTKIPTGRFREDTNEYMLDAGKRFSSQQEVLDVVVRRDGDGNFIRVQDLVTTARVGYRDPRTIISVNGKDAMGLGVKAEEGANALDMVARVKEIAGAFEKQFRDEGITLAFTNDTTIEIDESVNTLGGNMVSGLILVTLVLWITLGFRNAMLTAIGIPFSFLCSMIIMKATGVTLNTISLFAFVLVTGIIVDSAVIIVENIARHMEKGLLLKPAIIEGTSEIMMPVISSMLTTVLAFLPMLLMTGTVGEFLGVIPKTVTYALIASLFEALFILPVHVLNWGQKKSLGTSSGDEFQDPFAHLRSGIFAPAWRIYRWTVERLLNHKFITCTLVSALFFVCFGVLVLSMSGIMPLIKVELFPGNYFRYHAAVTMPPGTSLESTDQMVRDLSGLILSFGPEQAEAVAGTAGSYEDEDRSQFSGSRYGEVIVTLPDAGVRNFPENPDNDPMAHLGFIRKQVGQFLDKKFGDSPARPLVRVFEEPDGPPTGKAVNVRVSAMTTEQAMAAADFLMGYITRDPRFADVTDLEDNRPVLKRVVKYLTRQEVAFEYGLDPGRITSLVAGALNGARAGEYRTVDEEIDLLVRLGRNSDAVRVGEGLGNPMDVLAVPVVEDSASPVLLRDLVTASWAYETSVRSRYQARPTITLTANIKEGSKLSPARVQKLIQTHFEENQAQLPGIFLSYGGEFESTSKSFNALGIAFVIALMGIYMVLASQFSDYFQPVIIISAVPFALIGVVMGLFFTRTTFTLGSFMAVVGLAGIAVNNSLLLVDFMNVRRDTGASVRDAVIEACAARMRPVLITTITTMLGLLPMAIGIPTRSISWAPMATAFVTGLASATLLALLIVPVEYELYENTRIYLKRKFGK